MGRSNSCGIGMIKVGISSAVFSHGILKYGYTSAKTLVPLPHCKKVRSLG